MSPCTPMRHNMLYCRDTATSITAGISTGCEGGDVKEKKKKIIFTLDIQASKHRLGW